MKKRSIMVCAAVMCLLAGAVPAVPAYVPGQTVYAVEETKVTDSITLEVGTSVPITSSGEVTEKPNWRSDNEKVATVDQNGTVTAVAEGTAYVYAVFSNAIYKFEVKVVKPAEEKPVTINLGTVTMDNTRYVAKPELSGINNTDAKWSTSDDKVAKVEADGTITAVGKGSCVISAVAGNTTYTINITSSYDPEAQPSTTPGEGFIGSVTLNDEQPTRKIEATIPEGTTVTWSSTDETVAKVDSNGVITAVGSGSCRVYADVNGQKFYVEVTSEYTGNTPGETPKELMKITLDNAVPSRKVGLNNVPEGVTPKWSTSDNKVATVDNDGVVTAVGKGRCTVTVDVGGKLYTVDVTSEFDPDAKPETQSYTLEGIGTEMQLEIEGDPELISMNSDVATVDKDGKVKAVGIGEAVIVANFGGRVVEINIIVVPKTVYGDANEDGKINVADAVAILQNIANATKYSLTKQGMINADCDGNKGITGSDAIAVQMKDAGVVKALPLTPEK